VKIILRADSGFWRNELMSWCENNGVDYVFGLARNQRLRRMIGHQMYEATQQWNQRQTGAGLYRVRIQHKEDKERGLGLRAPRSGQSCAAIRMALRPQIRGRCRIGPEFKDAKRNHRGEFASQSGQSRQFAPVLQIV
jgi:hypothetical protein